MGDLTELERKYIVQYTGELYKEINEGGTMKGKSQDLVRKYNLIVSGLRKIYKNQFMPERSFAGAGYNVDKKYTLEVLRSTSVDFSVAAGFLRDSDSNIFEFVLPRGAFISSLSIYATETELILLPNEVYVLVHAETMVTDKGFVNHEKRIHADSVRLLGKTIDQFTSVTAKPDRYINWCKMNYSKLSDNIEFDISKLKTDKEREAFLSHFIPDKPEYNSALMYAAMHVSKKEGDAIINRVFEEYSSKKKYIDRLINYRTIGGETLMTKAIKTSNTALIELIKDVTDWTNLDTENRSYFSLMYIHGLDMYIPKDKKEKHENMLRIPDVHGRSYYFYNPTETEHLKLVDNQGFNPLTYRLMNSLTIDYDFMKPLVNTESKGYLPLTLFSGYGSMTSLIKAGAAFKSDRYGNTALFHSAVICPKCYDYLDRIGQNMTQKEKNELAPILLHKMIIKPKHPWISKGERELYSLMDG